MQEGSQRLLRQIPKVDLLLGSTAFKGLKERMGQRVLTEQLRAILEALRTDIQQGRCQELPTEEALAAQVKKALDTEARSKVQRVLNATGILLHTNLGRAPLPQALAAQVAQTAAGYCNLEYNLNTGRRGSRYDGIEPLLTRLTGTEAALVVNNNAATVLLILDTFAKGREVIVSRGEQVEIGGSFRVPEVMRQSGAILREVGATNKTHYKDYAEAIGPETAMLLKVHQSNFLIRGFTQEVSLTELRRLADEHELPLVFDLGSGLLHPNPPEILKDEPQLMDGIRANCDLICFSGDKLMGGPQAGMIVGKKAYIEKLKKNQLTRALRVDKLCLLALQALLEIYLDEKRVNEEIPFYQMLNQGEAELKAKAEFFISELKARGIEAQVQPCLGEIGGGSAPGTDLHSLAVCPILDPSMRLQTVLEALRMGTPAIVAYIQNDRLSFDMRTLDKEDLSLVAKALERAVRA